MAKQIMNVRDVMAVLEVSESKAYGIIRQMNDELKAKGFITIPGKVSTVFSRKKYMAYTPSKKGGQILDDEIKKPSFLVYGYG